MDVFSAFSGRKLCLIIMGLREKEGKQKWEKSCRVNIGENDELLCVNRTHRLNRSLGRFRQLQQQRVLLSSNIGVNNI